MTNHFPWKNTNESAERISDVLAKLESNRERALVGGSMTKSPNSRSGQIIDLAQFRKRLEGDEPTSNVEVIMKTLLWMLSDDTGASSEAIVMAGSGVPGEGPSLHPAGPYEFGRCVRLLRKIPELREPAFKHLKKEGGEIWSHLVDRWDEIAKCLEQETGIEGSKTKKAPRTYALMRSIMNGNV